MAGGSSQASRDIVVHKIARKKFPLALLLKIGAAVAALVVLAVVFGPSVWRQHCARRDARAIAEGLELYVMENRQFPQGSPAEICALLRGESRGDQNLKKLDYIAASANEMNAAGEFIDPWGTPYRISMSGKMRVYSCGPNQRDEQGTGDDLGSWD
jgi:hypothetical protein